MSENLLLSYEPLPALQPRPASGDAEAVIDLVRPDLRSGLPLMTALALRASTREFLPQPLPPAILGGLLWAANGINRPLSGGRTAPSAHAFHEIDVYVALPQGVYRYDPDRHALVLKHAIDARNLTGYQDFVGAAPLDLVYVVRSAKLMGLPASQRELFSAIAAGTVAQNAALYCASAGLASVVRGWINHRLLGEALSLNEDELPILAQTVGLPANVAAAQNT